MHDRISVLQDKIWVMIGVLWDILVSLQPSHTSRLSLFLNTCMRHQGWWTFNFTGKSWNLGIYIYIY